MFTLCFFPKLFKMTAEKRWHLPGTFLKSLRKPLINLGQKKPSLRARSTTQVLPILPKQWLLQWGRVGSSKESLGAVKIRKNQNLLAENPTVGLSDHGAQAASPLLPLRPPARTVSSLEGGRYVSPHLRVILSLLERYTGVNDLQFFCMENLSFLPISFFIQSLVYISIDSWAFVSYFGLYSDTILVVCCLKYDR